MELESENEMRALNNLHQAGLEDPPIDINARGDWEVKSPRGTNVAQGELDQMNTL
jgi:hypothetical protein